MLLLHELEYEDALARHACESGPEEIETMFDVCLIVRCLDDRQERRGLEQSPKRLKDDSSRRVELSIWRSRALHDVLDANSHWTVKDWGKTDADLPDDDVELWLELNKGRTDAPPCDIPSLVYVGKVLKDGGLNIDVVENVKHLLAKCRNKQETNQIGDFSIWFPEETSARVGCWPSGNVWITLCPVVMVAYDATDGEVTGLTSRVTEAMDIPTPLVPFVRRMISDQSRGD